MAITWGVTYGLVGYFGGKAAANVLAQAGIAGAALLVLLVVGFLVSGPACASGVRRSEAPARRRRRPTPPAHEEAGSS